MKARLQQKLKLLFFSLEAWDMAAAVIINREAGGKVTNLNGEEWDIDDGSIVIANPKIHRKLLDLLNG